MIKKKGRKYHGRVADTEALPYPYTDTPESEREKEKTVSSARPACDEPAS